jgi:hypothetical protein
VSELLAAAFHALGAGEEGLSWQETALVADALRKKSGEPEVEAVLPQRRSGLGPAKGVRGGVGRRRVNCA